MALNLSTTAITCTNPLHGSDRSQCKSTSWPYLLTQTPVTRLFAWFAFGNRTAKSGHDSDGPHILPISLAPRDLRSPEGHPDVQESSGEPHPIESLGCGRK
jgi:hypothetical protein